MIHRERSIHANQKVNFHDWVKHPDYENFNDMEFIVEDWWDRLYGASWKFANGNPACLIYALRTGFSQIPIPHDDDVLYGHTKDGLGHLVHISEIKVFEEV